MLVAKGLNEHYVLIPQATSQAQAGLKQKLVL